jgi:hypothetical protein
VLHTCLSIWQTDLGVKEDRQDWRKKEMISTLKIKQLECEIRTISLVRVFVKRFHGVLTMDKQPTVSQMKPPFEWIRKKAMRAKNPKKISDELDNCCLKAEEAFSKYEPLPLEIEKLCDSVEIDLKKYYDKLVRTTKWEIRFGSLKVLREEDKMVPCP